MYKLAAILTMSIVALTAPGMALGQERGGIGGALDQLNRTVNPSQDRSRESSGSSRDERGAYSRYSDQELREQSYRLEDEARRIERERRDIDGELDRRRVRR